MKIDRNDLRDPSNHRIAAGKTPTIPGAIPHGNDPFRIGDRMIGALQRFAHVLGHGPSHHQYVGMARRGNEPEAEALYIVVGVVKRVDFELASIARASV